MSDPGLSQIELHDAWPLLTVDDRVAGFSMLSRGEAEELFSRLEAREQAELIRVSPAGERRIWIRPLAPGQKVSAGDLLLYVVKQQDSSTGEAEPAKEENRVGDAGEAGAPK
jgi:hypothetical protein